MTSCSPQIINTKGNHYVQRFCAILNQKKELDLTNVPSQARPIKDNNTSDKSIVLEQVRKKFSEPNLDNNKYGEIHRKDRTNIKIQNTPPHPSDDGDTGGKFKRYGEQKQQDLESTGTVYQEDQQEHDT